MGFEHDVLWLILAVAGVFLAMYLSVFPHELGHALMAKAVGFKPIAIVWGNLHGAARRKLLGMRVLIGRSPLGGLMFYEPKDARWPRLRRMAITFAGPATNFLIAVSAFQLANLIVTPFHDSFVKSALLILGVANSLLVLGNLFPAYAVTPVGRFPNDGLKLIKTLTGSLPALKEERLAACILRIHFAHADKDPQKILVEADLAEELSAPASWIEISRSAAYCQLDRPEVAQALLVKLLESDEADLAVRAMAENNLAWALFGIDDPANDAEMLERSARAMEVLPWNAAVITTRLTTLAVRASRGTARAAEARNLLEQLAEVSQEDQARCSAALARGFLAIGEGDLETARSQLQSARALSDPGFAGRVLEVRLANP